MHPSLTSTLDLPDRASRYTTASIDRLAGSVSLRFLVVGCRALQKGRCCSALKQY
jgi:hypothetical protein